MYDAAIAISVPCRAGPSLDGKNGGSIIRQHEGADVCAQAQARLTCTG